MVFSTLELLLAKISQRNVNLLSLLSQLARHVRVQLFHHRQQHSSGASGVGSDLAVIKFLLSLEQPKPLVVVFIFRKWIGFPPAFQFQAGDNVLAGGFNSPVDP
jgi:hypothetical protein